MLEPCRCVDQVLHGVVMEAYIGCISTRKVDTLVTDLGVQSGYSKFQVRQISKEIDQQVQALLNQPLYESGYATPTSVSMPPTSTTGWGGAAGKLQSHSRGHGSQRRCPQRAARPGSG
ncbi:transposase [Cyanobium sp. ULC082]